MWLEPHRLLLIVLIIVIAVPRPSSSEKFALSSNVTPVGIKSGPKQLGRQCLEGTGDPSFVEVIKEKCYIDKTRYIDKLIKQIRNKYFFLARPKRLGKTLLVDTLEKFFAFGARSNDLFRDTEIYQRLSGNWARYPTIRLDFSEGFSFRSLSQFETSLTHRLLEEAKKYDIPISATINEGIIRELIELLSERHKSKVIILVDEYDTPYMKFYDRNKDEASEVLRMLQSFYSTLKGRYTKIYFCFVTGITRLALSDFFSRFNAAIDLTMDPEYAGIVGFNETELHEYFGDEIKRVASEIGKKEEEILEDMKTWHDGYQFTSKSETLYSPLSVIGYLRTNGESLMSWSDTGGPSQFLIDKLKEFPHEALKLIIYHETKRRTDADSMLQPSTILTATRRELTGKINYEVKDFRSLVALLFHSGYLSIESYEPKTDVFTLKFSNHDVKEDYSSRIADIIMRAKLDEEAIIVSELEAFHWESFIKKFDTFNHGVEYQITLNQREGLEAWFQFILSRILVRARKSEKVLREVSTSKGRADIVYLGEDTTFIFEPKMSQNDENPVFECKEKYHKKYLFNSKKDVVCIGLKFLYKGQIESWGVARFSSEGKLVEESGPIRLSAQLSFEEQQNIRNKMKENPQCPLKPDKVIEFLEQIGPTTEDQLVLVNKITEDPKTLCLVLKDIKDLVQLNLRYIIDGVVKAVEQNEERKEDQLSNLRKILSPVKDLYLCSNDFPTDFEKLTEFIYLCEKPGQAPLCAPAFTENIPKLLNLLERSHSVIKDKSIKLRITHICKNLKRKNSAEKSK